MHRPPEEEIFTVTKDRDHMVIGKILKYICYRLRLIVTRLKVLTHVKRKANIKRLRSSINCKVTLLHAPTIIMQHEKTIFGDCTMPWSSFSAILWNSSFPPRSWSLSLQNQHVAAKVSMVYRNPHTISVIV